MRTADRIARLPAPGELWRVAGDHSFGVYLGGGLWNVLDHGHGEYTLSQSGAMTALDLSPAQPAGTHWADQFDALAAVHGLNITWADEVLSYRMQGWEKIRSNPAPA